MRPLRVLHVAVFLMVAAAVLMPRPDVKARPALTLDPDNLARVSELQMRLRYAPGDAELALELADLVIDGKRPDFALSVLAPALAQNPTDHRLHFRRSLALADHFELGAAYGAAARALELCTAGSVAPCGETDRARLHLLSQALFRVKDIDVRENPNAVKERLLESLRPAWWRRSR